jgi:hypothetical protein
MTSSHIRARSLGGTAKVASLVPPRATPRKFVDECPALLRNGWPTGVGDGVGGSGIWPILYAGLLAQRSGLPRRRAAPGSNPRTPGTPGRVAPFVRVDGMITLASEGILVRADPTHGGEILDLIDLDTGRQLLGRPPFGSDRPCGGDLDEETWTRSYRGGWQTVLPNAGNACTVAGSAYGFHGRGSVDPGSFCPTTTGLRRLDGGATALKSRVPSACPTRRSPFAAKSARSPTPHR